MYATTLQTDGTFRILMPVMARKTRTIAARMIWQHRARIKAKALELSPSGHYRYEGLHDDGIAVWMKFRAV